MGKVCRGGFENVCGMYIHVGPRCTLPLDIVTQINHKKMENPYYFPPFISKYKQPKTPLVEITQIRMGSMMKSKWTIVLELGIGNISVFVKAQDY